LHYKRKLLWDFNRSRIDLDLTTTGLVNLVVEETNIVSHLTMAMAMERRLERMEEVSIDKTTTTTTTASLKLTNHQHWQPWKVKEEGVSGRKKTRKMMSMRMRRTEDNWMQPCPRIPTLVAVVMFLVQPNGPEIVKETRDVFAAGSAMRLDTSNLNVLNEGEGGQDRQDTDHAEGVVGETPVVEEVQEEEIEDREKSKLIIGGRNEWWAISQEEKMEGQNTYKKQDRNSWKGT
jgi:hypothetical protein